MRKVKEMKNYVGKFISSEDGAITVDWVVLTAAVMLLGVVVGATISTNVSTASSNVSASLTANTSSTTP